MTKEWHITGYAGFSDYDGPDDNNLDFTMVMDDSVTKDEIEALLVQRYSKHRTLSLSIKQK